MTQREFFTAIAAIETLDVELRDFAQAAIDKIDEDNAKKREKAAKKREENEPVKVAILEVLGDEPKPASEVMLSLFFWRIWLKNFANLFFGKFLAFGFWEKFWRLILENFWEKIFRKNLTL